MSDKISPDNPGPVSGGAQQNDVKETAMQADAGVEKQPQSGSVESGTDTGRVSLDKSPEQPEPARDEANDTVDQPTPLIHENEPQTEETPSAEKEEKALPGFWGDLFNGCAKTGPVFLFVMLCLMIWPEFWHPEQGLFCPGENRYISAYLYCANHASWVTPMSLVDGSWSVPQWPVFSWLTGLLSLIPGVVEGNLLLPLAAATGGALALWGVWFLTHTTGFGLGGALAAGIILLCAPLFVPLPHFFGPVALASALMLFSLGFFYRGWKSNTAWISLPAAFICAGLAGMCGGVLFFAVPLITCICFLIWQGKVWRAQKVDALGGFLLMLIIIGLWLGTIMLGHYPANYLPALFSDSIDATWPPKTGWWLGLVLGAAGLLPWLAIVICISWFRAIGKTVQSLKASRHDNGSALLWTGLVIACAISPFVPHSQFAAVAIACLGACLLGKAFVNLSPAGNRFFFFLASIFMIVAGLVILAGSFSFSQPWLFALMHFTPHPDFSKMMLSVAAIPIFGGICVVGGLFGFLFVRHCRQGGGLLYGSILVAILSMLGQLMILPDLAKLPEARLLTFQAIQQTVNEAMAAPVAIPENAEHNDKSAVEQALEDVVQENSASVTPAEQPVPQTAQESASEEQAAEPTKEPATDAVTAPASEAAPATPENQAAPEKAPEAEPGAAEPVPQPAPPAVEKPEPQNTENPAPVAPQQENGAE